MKLNTYLDYGGNCEQAFRYYQQYLGGKITMMMSHGQQPNPNDVPPDWKNAILHARLNIGETEIIAADVLPARTSTFERAGTKRDHRLFVVL